MRSFLSSVRVVAAKEFRDCWRNLWLIVGSALFACLSLAVVFGTAAIGGDFSFRPLEAVMTSVVTLGVFLIPLIAVLISYDAFVRRAGARNVNSSFNLSALPTGAFNRANFSGKVLHSAFACFLVFPYCRSLRY